MPSNAFSRLTHLKILPFINVIHVHSSKAKSSYKAQRKAARQYAPPAASHPHDNFEVVYVCPMFPRTTLYRGLSMIQF